MRKIAVTFIDSKDGSELASTLMLQLPEVGDCVYLTNLNGEGGKVRKRAWIIGGKATVVMVSLDTGKESDDTKRTHRRGKTDDATGDRGGEPAPSASNTDVRGDEGGDYGAGRRGKRLSPDAHRPA